MYVEAAAATIEAGVGIGCPSLTQTQGPQSSVPTGEDQTTLSWPVSGVIGTDKMDCWSLAIEYSCQDQLSGPEMHV
uniref:Uncharacterized protein n=1 Tax=Oryza meridionalis TaxID=40149 RepID=A0A0E0DZI3_9ORYZ